MSPESRIMTDKHETCWICGSSDSDTVLPKAWDSLYRRCNACGHQWELRSDYRDQGERYYEDDSHLYFSPFSQWLSASVARQRINALKQHLKSGHVLEIGPGTGEVILAAQREGFTVTAVEGSRCLPGISVRKRVRASTRACSKTSISANRHLTAYQFSCPGTSWTP